MSNNVFADLGLPDAEERLLKADLAIKIQNIFIERGYTIGQAAESIGEEQPIIHAIKTGNLTNISSDRLKNFLNTLTIMID